MGKYYRIIKPFTNECYLLKTDYIIFIYVVLKSINYKLNQDITKVSGNIILISQFTLQASTKKGNRPSFTEAAKPDLAIPLYQNTISSMSKTIGKKIETGQFGADMKVSLINDGPLTIVLDSKSKR